jgi:hypothetical protein
LYIQTPIVTTKNTGLFMHTNYFATIWANPFTLFLGNKFSYPKSINIFQIIDHTHGVPGPVTLVDSFYQETWKKAAFKTIFESAGLPYLTILDMALRTGPGFEIVFPIATRTDIFIPDIGVTETAIHPAGGNLPGLDRSRWVGFISLHYRSFYDIKGPLPSIYGWPRLIYLQAGTKGNFLAASICPEYYQEIDGQDKRQCLDTRLENTMGDGARQDRACPNAQ